MSSVRHVIFLSFLFPFRWNTCRERRFRVIAYGLVVHFRLSFVSCCWVAAPPVRPCYPPGNSTHYFVKPLNMQHHIHFFHHTPTGHAEGRAASTPFQITAPSVNF
ncbi:hypothetical protein E2C01_078088 [Portunus trituberculatus]|uniref:Uncharacterized protein n=1 Tax=Portunus trituberculatus TaxID=210409 RepID=A0A5B7IMY4_PORTR|nr:hypothetical protein [Portunus trituberculatus]